MLVPNRTARRNTATITWQGMWDTWPGDSRAHAWYWLLSWTKSPRQRPARKNFTPKRWKWWVYYYTRKLLLLRTLVAGWGDFSPFNRQGQARLIVAFYPYPLFGNKRGIMMRCVKEIFCRTHLSLQYLIVKLTMLWLLQKLLRFLGVLRTNGGAT